MWGTKFEAKCNHGSKVNESQSLQPKDSILALFSKSTITKKINYFLNAIKLVKYLGMSLYIL
jgi:hypothetical protein